MDALGVVLGDLVLAPRVAEGRFLPLAVTTSAQGRHVGGEGPRCRILPAENRVPAVALLAGGRIGIVGGQELPMLAALKLLGDLGVAGAAIDFFGDGLAGTHARRIHFGVALAARHLGVPRTCQLLGMDRERASIGCLQVRPGMAALAVGVSHALGVEDIADLVRLVAIDARRQHIRFFFPKFAADGLAVHLLDQSVALGAGGGDVLAGDGGVRVGMRQDAVRRVAGGTVGRHDQPFLQQALPVDTLGIVLQDVVLFDGPLRLHRRALAMALAAEERDIERRHRRAAIFDRKGCRGCRGNSRSAAPARRRGPPLCHASDLACSSASLLWQVPQFTLATGVS